MPVALKALSVKSVVDHTKWKTTDPWLGAAKLTPSLILLERPQQMMLTAPTPLSAYTAKVSTLLTAPSVHSGAIALTSSGMLTRLLSCALTMPAIATLNAREWATSDYD